MPEITIANRRIGDAHPCYIVAEVGINHNGDIDIARRLIRVASEAGCDAVKFQKRTPELAVPRDQWAIERDTPWGRMSYIDYRRRIELSMRDLLSLAALAKAMGLAWFASAWDTQACIDLVPITDAIKIPSAKITDWPLLRAAQASGLPVIASTGMSTPEEIEAVATYGHALLHCTSTYPCPPEELNLNHIPVLMGLYPNHVIGYSGHEVGLATTVAAVTLGAKIIERHITLDRSMWGTDQPSSLEPVGLERLVRDVRKVERSLGDGIKRVYNSELLSLKKLRGINAQETNDGDRTVM